MKRILNSILPLAAFLLLGLPALAQQTTDEEEPGSASTLVRRVGSVDEVRQLLATPGANARNQAMLVQQGNSNRLSVDQQIVAGSAVNLVQLEQVGDYNLLNVQQQGNGLTQRVLQQGNGNEVASRMQGSDVESTIRQSGNANKVQQDLNVSQRNYVIEQTNGGNELVQRESGAVTPTGYEVRMTGNMRVVIEHGP